MNEILPLHPESPKQGVLDQIEQDLVAAKISFDKHPELGLLEVRICCHKLECRVKVVIEGEWLTVQALLPIAIPEANSRAIADYALRYNHDRPVPTIEFCAEESRLLFRATSFLTPELFKIDIFHRMLGLAISGMEESLEEIVRLAFIERSESANRFVLN